MAIYPETYFIKNKKQHLSFIYRNILIDLFFRIKLETTGIRFCIKVVVMQNYTAHCATSLGLLSISCHFEEMFNVNAYKWKYILKYFTNTC